MTYHSSQAYDDAAKVDKALSKLLHKTPPTPETAEYWRLVLRTVRTGLDLVEALISPSDSDELTNDEINDRLAASVG